MRVYKIDDLPYYREGPLCNGDIYSFSFFFFILLFRQFSDEILADAAQSANFNHNTKDHTDEKELKYNKE